MASSNILGNFLNAIKLLFTVRGVLSITLVIVLFTGLFAIIESVQQNSLQPFVDRVGVKLVGFDNELFELSKKIDAEGGVVSEGEGVFSWFTLNKNTLLYFLMGLGSLWYIYFWLMVFFGFFLYVIVMNESGKTGAFIGAVLLVTVLIIISNIYLYYKADNKDDLNFVDAFKPYKGVYNFGISSFKAFTLEKNFLQTDINQSIINNATKINGV